MLKGSTRRALFLIVLCALLVSQALGAFEPEHSNKHSNHCELSVAVRKLEAVALGNPVMPVADGFFG